MYLQTMFEYGDRPKHTQDRLRTHFFKPYANPSSFARGLFYPIDAVFEDTIPNLILTTYLIGQTLFHTFACLGNVLILQGKNASAEGKKVLNSLFVATATLALAFLAPLFEAARFFTRWGATIADSLSPPTSSVSITVEGSVDSTVSIRI